MKRSVVITLAAFAMAFFAAVGTAYYQQRKIELVEQPLPSVTGPLTLGVILPLSGDAGAVGLPIRRAAELAVNEINAAGGVRGRPLRLDIRDTRCDAREAVNAAQTLISVAKVPIIFGGGCSSETLAVAPLAERAQVILFSPSATSPAITDAGEYVFRNAPSDAYQGRILATAAVARGYRRVGILSEETDYAVGIATVFQSRMKEEGGTTTLVTYPSGAIDVHGEVTHLAQTQVDAFLIIVQSPAKAALIFQELHAAHLRLPLLVNDVVLGATDVLASYPNEAEGLLGADFNIDETSSAYQGFLQRYHDAYGEAPSYPLYAALSYDAMRLLSDALREAGTTPTAIREYLGKVLNHVGVSGTLTLDNNGDPVAGHILKEMIHGKLTRVATPSP